MISGISGAGGSRYLTQISQAATSLISAGGSGLINTAKAQNASKTRDVPLSQIFTKIDTDGDGVVSKEEFDSAKSEEGKKSQALANLDTGSTASLVSLLESVKGTGETGNSSTTTQNGSVPSDKIFGKIDTNGDGVIGRDEFENLSSALTSSIAGSTAGTSGGSSVKSAQQNIAASVASQNKALMQQAISQYARLAGSGQGVGATGLYM